MGLTALIISAVIDAIWPLRGREHDLPAEARNGGPPPEEVIDTLAGDADARTPDATSRSAAAQTVPHPLQRHAQKLIEWVSPHPDFDAAPGARRQLALPGWLAVVGIPVVLIAIAHALLREMAGILVLSLHVAVLYLTVGLGAFHRQFSELRLLVGAGEEQSARALLARWMGAGTGAPAEESGTANQHAASRPLAAWASSHAILAAYRDVFAPLFWYVVLPGAIGPVLYLFARFAACLSYPFARTAYYWLDWIPLRLAALAFGLVGNFEDTIFCLKTVNAMRPAAGDDSDPYLHQRLLLLPVAGGALGLRLTDATVDDHLRRHGSDLDLPGDAPQSSSLRPVAGLLMRSGVVWVLIYLLVVLLN